MLEAFEHSIVLSIVGECALALESDKAAREREEAAVLAKNVQLRANLLRSIGHYLRSPLTAISGSAAVLRDGGTKLGDATRLERADAIYDDSLWLIDTVENLPAITRIDDADMQLSLTSELMDEVIAARSAARSSILVVEDDPAVRNLVTTALDLHGYSVEKATDGETAIMDAASRNPDLIMLDLGLPDIDGVEVINKIRSWSAVPIPSWTRHRATPT